MANRKKTYPRKEYIIARVNVHEKIRFITEARANYMGVSEYIRKLLGLNEDNA